MPQARTDEQIFGKELKEVTRMLEQEEGLTDENSIQIVTQITALDERKNVNLFRQQSLRLTKGPNYVDKNMQT